MPQGFVAYSSFFCPRDVEIMVECPELGGEGGGVGGSDFLLRWPEGAHDLSVKVRTIVQDYFTMESFGTVSPS